MGLGKAPQLADRIIRQISRVMGMVAVIILVVMMLLTVAEVFLRYVFNRPILGCTEYIEYLMVFVGFLGLAWCASKGMHIKVELLVGRFSERAQEIFNTANALLVIAICVVIIWRSFVESNDARLIHWASTITNIPWYPFYYVIALGFILLLLVMITVLVKSLIKAVKK
ncbi:MAG: TRAP transporter small permease [Planctomycetota bacterium]|nr:MAG: TRAP transporter small permease [Planctomycetota bacterium]